MKITDLQTFLMHAGMPDSKGWRARNQIGLAVPTILYKFILERSGAQALEKEKLCTQTRKFRLPLNPTSQTADAAISLKRLSSIDPLLSNILANVLRVDERDCASPKHASNMRQSKRFFTERWRVAF
jgi:hypothetical protein